MTEYTKNRIEYLENKVESLNKKRIDCPVGSIKRKSLNTLIKALKEMIDAQK